MKQDKNKHLRFLAEKIMKLEKRISLDKNDEDAKKEIEKLMCSLNFEEMLYLDNYIMRKHT